MAGASRPILFDLTSVMLETVGTTATHVTIRAMARKVGVYLDNFAIIDIAKGDASRRERFLEAFWNGADLLFSTTNAAEITGPTSERSVNSIRSFLDAIGPNWVPIDGIGVVEVMNREAAGNGNKEACVCNWFLNQFFAGRNIQLHGEQRLGMVDADFFKLSFVLDWLQRQREDNRGRLADFDKTLRLQLERFRQAFDRNKSGFHKLVPPPIFDRSKPATFAWQGLVRCLVLEARAFRFKPGDGADLCHATMGTAYSNFAALDKQWKRRVVSLPKPNGLARVYYQQELDQLVEDVVAAVTDPSKLPPR